MSADTGTIRLAPSRSRTSTPRLDLKSLARMLRRRWKLFLLVAIPVFLAVVIITLRLTPVYTSQALITIDPSENSPLDFKAVATGAPPDQALIDTQVELMRSRESAAEIVRQYRLLRDPEFAARKPGTLQGKQEQVINTLLNHMSVARQGTTYVVELTVRSIDGAKAAALANAFAGKYIESSVRSRVGNAVRQSSVLDKRLDDLGAQARTADEELARYRASTGLSEGAGQSITDQQIAPLSTQIATAESEAAAARAAVSAAQSQIARGGIGAVSGVLTSNVIADLRGKRADLLRDEGQISARYGQKHPEYVRVSQQIAGIDSQIEDESRRIVSGLQSDAQAANARAASLRGELNRLRSEQASNMRASATAEGLKRQADSKSSVYSQTAEAAQRINQQEKGAESQARIVQPAAIPPGPSFPSKSLFGMIGVVLATIVGFTTVLTAEALSSAMRTPEDVEDWLGLPFLGSIPQLKTRQLRDKDGEALRPGDYVLAKPMSNFGETLRAIRQTLIAGNGARPTVVAVASALPREGKSTTATALARIMAMSGDRVILVDCDLRRNALAGLTDAPRAGLVELLDGKAALDEVLVPDRADGLMLLPLAAATFTPQDVFSRDAMPRLLEILKTRADFVVLDTPPVLAVADARVLARLADDVLLLVRWDKTPRLAVRAAVDKLVKDEVRITGVLLSGVDSAVGGLGPDDAAYYAKSYRSYYQE